MVAAVAFVPSAPLLLDALGGGPTELRSACLQAMEVLDELEVVVLGAAPSSGWVTGSVDPTPYGVRGLPAADPLPLALAVGVTLLGARRHRLYGIADSSLPEVGEDVGLLVEGDGSARRTEKAPGHLDPRGEGFDAEVERALAAGDPAALGSLDEELAAQLMVDGLRAWRTAAGLAAVASGPWCGRVLLASAPFGVGYLVATWTRP